MPPPTTIRATPAFETTPPARPPAYIQGVYWVLTGIWPVVHRHSFEWATGPKADFWLVELVGLLLAVMGATMIMARARDRITFEVGLMAMGATVALIVISALYASRERIAPVYLVDAGLETLLLAGWIRWAVWRPKHRVVTAPVEMRLPPVTPTPTAQSPRSG